MLILTRRIGETVKVGDNIDVTVVDVKGNQVRIGFQAPEDVLILRPWEGSNPQLQLAASSLRL